MVLQRVTEQNFEAEVLLSELPVLVEFGASWCGPCKTVEPELLELAAELQGRAKIVTVDIDECPNLAQQLRIQSVPTFMVISQGQPVGGKAGALKKAQLAELLEPVLPRPAGALKPREVAQLVETGRVCLVDIRDQPVYERTRIAGALNLPSKQLAEQAEQMLQMPLPPVLYCRTGADAKEQAEQLAKLGAPVSYLEGGVLAWEEEGYSLERPD